MKKILWGILAIVAMILAGYMVAKYIKTVETNGNNINANEVNNVMNSAMNEIKNEFKNIAQGNEIINEIDNITENVIINEKDENDEEMQITETNGAQTGEDDRQKAINMAKQEWGEDSNVSFKIDEQTEDGKFVVSVVDKNTTKVIFWYNVDVKNNTIEEK